jgi:hypothetical protein
MKRLVLLLVLVAGAAGCGGTHKATSLKKTQATLSSNSPQCDASGITKPPAREGVCTFNGVTVTVADRAHWLHAGEYDVRVVGVRTATTLRTRSARTLRAHGKFVVIRLSVKNTSNAPRAFDSSSGLVSLLVDKKHFTESREAETDPSLNSFRLRGHALKPGDTATGTVAFELPLEHAKHLYAAGSDLVFLNFSDEASGYPVSPRAPKKLGFIRLWK